MGTDKYRDFDDGSAPSVQKSIEKQEGIEETQSVINQKTYNYYNSSIPRKEKITFYSKYSFLALLAAITITVLVASILLDARNDQTDESKIINYQWYLQKEVQTTEDLKKEYLTNKSLNDYEKLKLLQYIYQFDPNPKYKEWAKQEMESLR
ncbi:MAG: hypothetical protein QNJ37_00310 [Crocosphaera sp.]|nr:hypothetical protein [Crocosphaera sp.]